MEDADVLAKRDVAVKWCEKASAHAATCSGKPWRYARFRTTRSRRI